MSEDKHDVNPMFLDLVVQLQGAAWIHMGKVANPATGKIERNLDAARGAIDMLGMIEEKTRGNLVKDEEDLLRELLRQVRLNFVNEQNRPAAEASAAPRSVASTDAASAEAPAGDDEAPSNEEASESKD